MKDEKFSPEVLRNMRLLSGRTLTELGTETGVNPSRLCLFERGQHDLRQEQKAALYDALFRAMEIRAAVIGKILGARKLALVDAPGG